MLDGSVVWDWLIVLKRLLMLRLVLLWESWDIMLGLLLVQEKDKGILAKLRQYS